MVITSNTYGKISPCNAPFNNMYFTARGKVSPCWKLPGYCDNWSPTRSIYDIWKGEHFEKYRNALEKNIFIDKCKDCKHQMDEGVWPLAKAYEKFPINEYPSLMEMELSNQCNLECVMCSGELSSAIRKNRDKLPPLPQIYTEKFREELHEFIPHLTELRFNGGEPFSQKIVLDICNDISKINPGLKITIATNGTVLNKRVRHILDNNNIHLNISIDSLIKERYESIRVNSDFNKLMKNTYEFSKYCKSNKRTLSIMVNPMRNNWEEMPDFVRFTDVLGCSLGFNTILYPAKFAIWNLPSDEIASIIEKLQYVSKDFTNMRNYYILDHFVNNQLKNWLLDSYVVS